MFGVGEGRGEDRLLECVRRPGETRTECAKDPPKVQSQDPKLWWAPEAHLGPPDENETELAWCIQLCCAVCLLLSMALRSYDCPHSPIIALNPFLSFMVEWMRTRPIWETTLPRSLMNVLETSSCLPTNEFEDLHHALQQMKICVKLVKRSTKLNHHYLR
jgi:hypothetical protein